MTINISMSKEEFNDYQNYEVFKNQLKCDTIDLKENINELCKMLLTDGLWEDNNEYDEIVKRIFKNLNTIEGVNK